MKVGGFLHFLGLMETDGNVYVDINWKNEMKDSCLEASRRMLLPN